MTTTTATDTTVTPTDTAARPGLSTQISDFARKNMGQAGPLADKAKGFAKQRPAATATLVGVVGLAILNTLRGRR
ncbi:hypothetical protein [Sphingomonas aerophila]|uniref:Uncharacterized protein n=1 Tax=Sphingomonas aerophila TaxID=1344948 RepID=A0A7W9BB34_9SPHN|nr:hypothetical protein [Sphingomonas aerophila]MBB5713546.1 hypothetical protein [Sphingomonas aerophila]